jgi:hypothetical protein
VGPVPAGAGIYAQRLREKRESVTREGIEEAVEAFKQSCSAQQVVCRRIEYEEQDPFTAMIAEARYNDLTIFGLRSIFDYGFTSDPNKAIVKLVTQGVAADSGGFRPVPSGQKGARCLQRLHGIGQSHPPFPAPEALARRRPSYRPLQREFR